MSTLTTFLNLLPNIIIVLYLKYNYAFQVEAKRKMNTYIDKNNTRNGLGFLIIKE